MVQAMSGLMSLTGDPDGPPYRAGISMFDVMAGMHTAIAILAALHHRDATGEGQHVEASLLASALSGMVNQTSAYVTGGVVPFRMGNSHPSLTPYEPLPTADRELIVTAGNDTQFRRLCEVIGAPELADDPRFATNEGRTANRDELRPLLAQYLGARTAAEWFDELIAAGVPAGPINTVDAGVAFARDIGLEPVVTAGHGEAAMPTVRHPIIYSATPPSYPLPPPALNEHGEEVRAWLAGPPGPRAGGPAPASARRRERHMTQPGRSPFPHLAGRLRPGHDHPARPEPGRRPHGQGRVRRAGAVAGDPAPPHPVAGPGVRGGAGGAGRPRLHPNGDRGPADLPERARFGAGSARGRPARRRLPLPGGHRGRRAVPVGCAGRAEQPLPTDDAGWDMLALAAVTKARAERKFVPGLGHPVHKVTDPRTPALIAIADQEGLRGPHLRLFEAIGRVHPQVLGRTLPLNGAGTCGAALADLGLPPELLRGFALLARTAGLLGQLAEERRRPVGMDIYLTVEHNAENLPPEPA